MNAATIDWLNRLPEADARDAFRRCCGAGWWCDRMAASRPFADPAAVTAAADWAFDAMPTPAWLEAFAAHPKIG
ncbi:MAG: 2-oxo-4-hydroxy-4-carboxy-5-ureidoimidazoline decarboxylase, partial [Planctomycetota bacterium]